MTILIFPENEQNHVTPSKHLAISLFGEWQGCPPYKPLFTYAKRDNHRERRMKLL